MSTLAIIEDILMLSGPFTSATAREKHQRWLEGKPTDWLLIRRQELRESSQRPNGQAKLGLRYSR